jgi:hypothetical protein
MPDANTICGIPQSGFHRFTSCKHPESVRHLPDATIEKVPDGGSVNAANNIGRVFKNILIAAYDTQRPEGDAP